MNLKNKILTAITLVLIALKISIIGIVTFSYSNKTPISPTNELVYRSITPEEADIQDKVFLDNHFGPNFDAALQAKAGNSYVFTTRNIKTYTEALDSYEQTVGIFNRETKHISNLYTTTSKPMRIIEYTPKTHRLVYTVGIDQFKEYTLNLDTRMQQ